MSELELSFATKDKKKAEKAIAAQGLDLSFTVEKADRPMLASDLTQQIISDRAAGKFPQKAEGFIDSAADFFTGNARETNATENLPELGGEMGVNQLLGKEVPASASVALLTAVNPVEFVKILEKNTDKPLNVRSDEAGNVILEFEGREVILNKPGFSPIDALQLGGAATLFAPSTRLAAGSATLGKAVLTGGAASGATQTAIETQQSLEGGDIDPTDIGVSTLAGGASEVALPIIRGLGNFVKGKISGGTVSKEVIEEAQEFIINAGISPDVAKQLDAKTLLDLSGIARDATEQGGEFGIQSSKGQQSGSAAQLSLEDRLRSGALGEKAQNIMLAFEETQRQQVNQARSGVAEQLGGEPLTRGQAGQVVKQGIQGAEQAAEEAVSLAYEEVGDVAISPDGVSNILKATRGALRSVEFDKTLPETSKLLDQIQGFEKKIKSINKSKNITLKPIDMKRIEQMRRRLNTAIGAADNLSDKRQVRIMKRAFDDGIDKAIDQGLYSGDKAAVESLKQARSTFAEYAKVFRSNPQKTKSGRNIPDKAGDLIERIVADNPTDEQVVNQLLGAANINNSAGTVIARRYKQILGEDSEGWQAIRQEAFKRLVKSNKVNGEEVISAQQSIKAYDDAIDKAGSLMRELFSNKELATMRRFLNEVKKTQPDLVRSRENPSGTTQVASKTIQDTFNRLTQALAFGGEPLFAITAAGVSKSKGFKSTGQAKDAIRPFTNFKAAPALPAAGVTASASSASQSQQGAAPSSR